MSTSTEQRYERITVQDVKVGDRVARTRTATFHAVKSITEGHTTRRLHFASEPCPEPPLLAEATGSHRGRRYCPACNRWENSGDSSRSIVNAGHGTTGGGNIRPRRTAKLWREVV